MNSTVSTRAKGLNSHTRRDGLYLLGLGCAVFTLLGFVLATQPSRVAFQDFRTAYYNGLCLLQRCDPYNEADMQRLYSPRAEAVFATERSQLIVLRNTYLPVTAPFTVLLALLPYKLALFLWVSVIFVSFILASFLMWQLAAGDAPVLAGGLIAFCLANSASILYFANPAGFVVPFTLIAVWCFVKNRFVPFGIAFLTVALLFKPHDAGLIWLYFLLAGQVNRKRALQVLGTVLLIGIPGVLWVSRIAPHWPAEISENLRIYSSPGGMNDPAGIHGASLLTNLQSFTSFFFSVPADYDRAAHLFCIPLLAVWAYLAWRLRPSAFKTWFALASIAALTMLPVYHRQYDAKLLLLTVPACCCVWVSRSPLRGIALAVTACGLFFNGDLPWVAFLSYANKFHLPAASIQGRILLAVWNFPVPLSLLLVSVFYLLLLLRERTLATMTGECLQPQRPSP